MAPARQVGWDSEVDRNDHIGRSAALVAAPPKPPGNIWEWVLRRQSSPIN